MITAKVYDDRFSRSNEYLDRQLTLTTEKSRLSNDLYLNATNSGVLRCEIDGLGCPDIAKLNIVYQTHLIQINLW